MARPIKDTPILSAEEWERLEWEMEHVKPISDEERDEQRKAYELLQSIATFPL
ncbi:MAG: hypothetical protein LBC98_09975 [Prevotellaceae bacterium]|jgi:hypothetical protein|nr:hypothetical protein [Prevotellaceae bacterium]